MTSTCTGSRRTALRVTSCGRRACRTSSASSKRTRSSRRGSRNRSRPRASRAWYLSYQERRIYHWHEELDRRIGAENVREALRVPRLLDRWLAGGVRAVGNLSDTTVTAACQRGTDVPGLPRAATRSRCRALLREQSPARPRHRADRACALHVARVLRARGERDVAAASGKMVCREEELAEPGDTCVYDVVGKSFLVTRDAGGRDPCLRQSLPAPRRASCMLADGHVDSLSLPVPRLHLGLDGSLRSAPCRWDFAHADRTTSLRLPEARTAHLGWLRVHQHGPGRAVRSSRTWRCCPRISRAGGSRTAGRQHTWRRSIACNWKVAQEAFHGVVSTYRARTADPRRDRGRELAVRRLRRPREPQPHRFAGAEPAPRRRPRQRTHDAGGNARADVATRWRCRADGAGGTSNARRARRAESRVVREGLGRRLVRRDGRRDARRDGLQRVPELRALGRLRARTSSTAGGRRPATSHAASWRR